MNISGTTAVVTGAASGLGAATATLLAQRGATVLGLDLPSAVEQASPVEGVTLVATDVTDVAQVSAALDRAGERPDPLRIIVSCAGIAPSARLVGKAGAHDPALFAQVLQVNLVGTFNLLSLGAERIAATEPVDHGQRGVIVNTASIAAFEGQVGQVAYAASKGGVVALALPAARALARHGLRVNTIAPGIMETPMIATVAPEYLESLAAGVPHPRRLGRPDEYAALVATIVEHDYLNGEVIRMDGALRMS